MHCECADVCNCLCVYFMSRCMYVRMCVFGLGVCKYVCIYIHVYIDLCMCVFGVIGVHVHMQMYTCVHTCFRCVRGVCMCKTLTSGAEMRLGFLRVYQVLLIDLQGN